MKITKRGELPGDKIWMGRCSVCKSEAEATQSELQGCIDSDPRDGHTWAMTDCPVCKEYYSMYFYPRNDAVVKANQTWIRE